ncbi:MAG: zinc-ribbon domain-containing protein [Chloroflexi bacterium]|nr:MAG: zinc-ribbon domain-containing protein [Chloroflexota bacterium]
MTTCTNCAREIPDTTALCPNCGTSISASIAPPIPERPGYMPPQQSYTPPLQPQSGYMPPPQPAPYYMPPPQQGYMPQPPQQTYYGPQHNVPPMYQQGPAVNVTVVNNTSTSSKSNTPVIVEVILSIFGIYGVGWLIAGETTTGIILLACSILVYWPIMVFMAIFTIGICDFPVAIAAIVINAVLLNRTLNRKATPITSLYTG